MSLTEIRVSISSPAIDELAPLELLAAVHEHGEVDPHLRVQERGGEPGPAVDDREHRRRHEVGVSRGPRGLEVEMERVGLADRARVLADLLAPDGVGAQRKLLPGRCGIHRHGGESFR